LSVDLKNSRQTSSGREFDAALIQHFASRQNVSAIATIVVALAVTAVIWTHVPRGILIAWVAAQIAVVSLSFVRWKRIRHIEDSAAIAHGLMVEAVAWKTAAGALWGTLGVFNHFYLPQSLEFFAAIAVASLAVGGVSTMAANPRAASAFAISCFAPFIVLWFAAGDFANITLGVLAILLLGVILSSVRTSNGQLWSILQAERDHRQLSEEYEAARGEWLELSDAAEAYVLFDDQDRLLAWNERYVDLFEIPGEFLRRGTPRADLIRSGRQTVDVASGLVPIEKWLRERTAPASHDTVETSVREYQGGLWLQRRLHRTKNGKTVVSFVDWTDLVKMENALRESEERYRLIAENSPDAIFVRVDDELVYVNPAAVKMLRAQSEKDLLGSSIVAFYHPGDLNAVNNSRLQVKQTPGEPVPFFRARMRRLDGTYVMTEGSGTNHIWHGQPAVLITRRDITSQIEAEERLRESEARYRRIAELAPVAILIRVEDRIVYANPAAVKVFGAESEVDLLYETAMSFVHPDDRHIVLNNRAGMTEDMDGSAPRIRVRRRRFDGTYFSCEGSGAPIVWQGQPAVMIMFLDVTDEDETERPVHASAHGAINRGH
jgi:PAS domain S-box-containing protein